MLTLRALEPEDIDILYAVENDAAEWGTGNTTVPYSRYALRDYIANNAYDIYTDRQLRQVVVDEGGEVVGFADLVNFEPRHRRAEVSLVIAPAYRHRHYATEALRAMVGYAADFLGLAQLHATTAESNQAARRLLENCGFEQTATLQKWLFVGGGTTENMENACFFQLFLKK